VSFEVFRAVMIQVEVFWVMTQCSVVTGYQRFRGTCYLHVQAKMKSALTSETLEDGGSLDL
jgi:hypothetical protein